MSERLLTVIALVVFTVAVCAFFSDVLFGDRVLLTCNTNLWQPWRAHATQEELGEETYRTDSARTYLPRTVELRRRTHAGSLALWNPHIFCGHPFLADPQSRAVYPISLLLTLTDPIRAMGYDVALHILIAMIGMYLFLRRVGSLWMGSILGGFAYGLSSFFFTRLGHPTFAASASWIPLFFYAFEKAGSAERTGTLMLTVFLSLGFLAGFPQVFLFGVSALIGYALYLSIGRGLRGDWHFGIRSARVIGIAGGLSALLVAVQLVPFIELTRNSVGLGMRLETMKTYYLSDPLLLIRMLVPNFFGNAVQGTNWLRLLGRVTHPYNSGFLVYCGLGGVIAAAGGIALARRSPRAGALLLLGLLSGAIASTALFLTLAYKAMPFFRYSQIDRISVVTCFAVAGLAGLGFSAIFEPNDRGRRRPAVWVALILAGAIIVGAVAFYAGGETVISDVFHRTKAVAAFVFQSGLGSQKVKEWHEGRLHEWLAYERKQVLVAAVFAAVCGLLVLLWRLRSDRLGGLGRLLGVGFVLVVVIDCVLAARTFYVSQSGGSLARTESVRLLQEAAGPLKRWRVIRLTSGDVAMPRNTNQIFGLCSVGGVSTVTPLAYSMLLEKASAAAGALAERESRWTLRRGAVTDLVCAKYMLADTLDPRLIRSPVLRAVAEDGTAPVEVRLLSLGGESRMALVVPPGSSRSVTTLIPGVSRLDFSVGFQIAEACDVDSAGVFLRCSGSDRTAEFTARFDVHEASGVWHDFRLDISDMGPGYVTITMGSVPERAEVVSGLITAWGGLEPVYGDCLVRAVERGFEVTPGPDGEVLALRLATSAAELPLEITGGDTKTVRWVGFNGRSLSRVVMLKPDPVTGNPVTVVSDSCYSVLGAKMVYVGRPMSIDYDIVYDGDMYVIENLAAVEKGICLERGAFWTEPVDGQKMVGLKAPGRIDDFRCGSCRLVTYGSERVALDVLAEKDCILLFQDLYYPGWQAFVDGVSQPVLSAASGIRALELKQGRHKVVMEYRPGSLKVGLGLTILGLVLAIIYGTTAKRWNESGTNGTAV